MRLTALILVMIGSLLAGCSAQAPSSIPVRQHFVPDATKAAQAQGTHLEAPAGKNISMAQIWLGVGGTFPCQDRDGKTLFNLTLQAGDDEHLVVEISQGNLQRKIALDRDKTATAHIGGVDYDLEYSSVYTTDTPASNQAMIVISTASSPK